MNPTDRHLPEWLIADCADQPDREFVLHCHWPRFLIEVDDMTELEIVRWWDAEAEYIEAELKAGREPAATLARLMRQAGEFYLAQLEETE